jgi:hypothetical protein
MEICLLVWLIIGYLTISTRGGRLYFDHRVGPYEREEQNRRIR